MKNAKILIGLGLLLLMGCPPPGSNQPGQGPVLNPESCGTLPTNDVSRKVTAFLKAAVLLDKESKALEAQTKKLCMDMGRELGMKLSGDTKTVCNKVSAQLKSDLNASLKPNAKFVVKHKPAVCRVNLDTAISAQAKCEARAEADVRVSCKGTCQGSCQGRCAGTCSVQNADGTCAGQCAGSCEGSCSGTCEGEARASGSAECQAEAEVRANLEAKCTPPELEIVFDATLVVNQAKLDKSIKAIKVGLPGLLALSEKASGPVLSSAITFARTANALIASAGQLAESLGVASLCVANQFVAAAAVAVSVQVSITVSVEASASVGGSCGATTN